MTDILDADPCLASAIDLVALLHRREIGAEELLDLHLARMEQRNRSINAVVVFDLDRARATARRIDAKGAGEDRGLLCGLPMTVKETWGVQGLRTTVGLPFLAGNIASEDSKPVARLRAEGAVIFGKSNVPIGGADHQTANPIYGLTRNPWDLSRTVGGSSGGAAAALATGLTPLELGSDIGGSIRIPAHMCGLFGHKGSFGLIPTLGHVPPMPEVMVEPELSVAGPMARTAADLELGLDALTRAGPQVRASRHERLSDFRIALWTGDLPYAASAETKAAIDDLAQALSARGATVSTTARPDFDPMVSLENYIRSLFSIVLGGQPFRVDEAERATLGDDALWYADVLEQCANGSGPSWQALSDERSALKAAWARFFCSWDAIVCPVFPTTAFEHDLSGDGIGGQLHRRRQVDGQSHVYLSQLSWPSLATVADLPATAVPVPRRAGELPLGLQLIGPFMEDRTLVRLAALLEAELGYSFRAPPPQV